MSLLSKIIKSIESLKTIDQFTISITNNIETLQILEDLKIKFNDLLIKYENQLDDIREINWATQIAEKQTLIVLQELRKNLLEYIDHPDEPHSDIHYQTLLMLAEHKPLNEEDIITFEPISGEDRVFISTGYQFSFMYLLQFHYIRPLRDNEIAGQKELINPITNVSFHWKDIEHILAVAADKNIQIEDLQKPKELMVKKKINTAETREQFSSRFFSSSLNEYTPSINGQEQLYSTL